MKLAIPIKTALAKDHALLVGPLNFDHDLLASIESFDFAKGLNLRGRFDAGKNQPELQMFGAAFDQQQALMSLAFFGAGQDF